MSIKLKHLVLLLTIIVSGIAISNYYIDNKYASYAEIHRTTSGMYALIGNKIYTLEELKLEKDMSYGIGIER